MKICDLRRWRVSKYASLVWRRWDNEYVFHHALSNDTHRISDIPGQLVVYLHTTGEQSTQELAEQFLLNEIDTEHILAELAILDFVTCRY